MTRPVWLAGGATALGLLCATPAAAQPVSPAGPPAAPAGPQAAPAAPPGPPAAPPGPPAAPPGPPATQQPLPLELGAYFGVATRIGDAPNFEIVERAGLDFGAAAYLTVAPAFSLGLLLEHTDLGRERSNVGELGAVEVVRDLNVAWASLRLNLVRGSQGTFGLNLGAGLAWQSAEASGVFAPGLGGAGFSCSASGSADLALRAGLGGALSLGGGLWLTGGAGIDHVRLSSEVMDTCVPGAGTAAIFGARAGFSYVFDAGRYVR